ncbi:MAG: shikimate dehydrogenase [Bacteroidetes bacterium]|nr:shikimate dehydrogenase [Bacteroidota bacterium]
MRKFGLIGYPLGHSFSKKYFTEKFAREGRSDCQFELYEFPEVADFPALIQQEKGLEGLSVTIPYKEQIIPFLDTLDPACGRIGAVNCIRIRDGKKVGFNTDYLGFKQSLQAWLGDAIPSALVLGTGGASKAVQQALRDLGVSYRIVSRSKQEGQLTYQDLFENKTWLENHPLLINTTPLGTYPKVEGMPELPLEQLDESHFVYDLVYNPPITRLMQECMDRRGKAKNGQDMLELQAEAAWRIWNSAE